MSNGKFRLHPLTKEKFSRGDWNEDETKRFLSYRTNHVKKNGEYAERWATPEKYEKQIRHLRESKIKYMSQNTKIDLPKRKNPLTNEHFKVGDRRQDGYRFIRYAPESCSTGQYTAEIFMSPKAYLKFRVGITYTKLKKRAKANNVPLKIDKEYLLEIFPTNKICPVFGIKMSFGGNDRRNSPSVDRLIPELGYVPKNVVWVSQEANQLKSDRTSSELRAIANWIENQPIYQKYQ